MTTWGDFVIRLIMALFLSTAIGIEKQWDRFIESVRINSLIAICVATYTIAIERSLVETNFIIIGISLICASIIARQNANDRNIESAIILWCSGIIGLLIGSDYFMLAYGSTLAIIIAKLIFSSSNVQKFSRDFIKSDPIAALEIKPVEKIVDNTISNTLTITENYYHCKITCDLHNEAHVLASLVQSVQEQNIILTGLQSDNQFSNKVKIDADFIANDSYHRIELQKIFNNLKSQVGVNSISWHQVIHN